jgi:hypothetical protein
MKRALLLLPVVLLAACTQYGSMGLTGGVDAVQLAEDTYRITAKGNAWASADQIEDFVLLKASELAIARGYKGFVINSAVDRSQAYSITTPGYATTNTYGSASGTAVRTGNVVTGQAYGSSTSTTTITPPITRTGIKPGSSVIVTLVQSGGMDARMIYLNLGPKHGAPPMPGATPVVAPAGVANNRALEECQALGLRPAFGGNPEAKAWDECYSPRYLQYIKQ